MSQLDQHSDRGYDVDPQEFIARLQRTDSDNFKDVEANIKLLEQARKRLHEQADQQQKKILLLKGVLKISVVVLLTYTLINYIGHLTESPISLPNMVIITCGFIFCITLYPLRKMQRQKAIIDKDVLIHEDLFKKFQGLKDIEGEGSA